MRPMINASEQPAAALASLVVGRARIVGNRRHEDLVPRLPLFLLIGGRRLLRRGRLFLDAERQAKNAYQDAVWFRKNGDWRSANIDAKDLDRLIDTLRQETAKTVLQRANAQHIFETAARKQFGDEPAHILERDTVLAEATEHFDTSESVAENAFTVWLAARGLTPPERRKKHKLKM